MLAMLESYNAYSPVKFYNRFHNIENEKYEGEYFRDLLFLIVLSNSYLVSLLEDYGLCFTIPVFSVPPRSTNVEFLPGQLLFQ